MVFTTVVYSLAIYTGQCQSDEAGPLMVFYIRGSTVLRFSQANLNQDLDVTILVVRERFEPLFFDFVHLDLSRYHWFWFDFSYVDLCQIS